jgi:hypothetical protein
MRQRPADSTAALPAFCPARPACRQSLTVAAASEPRQRRNTHGKKTVTVASYFDGRADDQDHLPMIRLRGQWLQRLGFRAGERLIVTEEEGRILLTLVRDEER